MALTTLPTAAFASGSVGTAQLADGAVTTEKMKADVNFRNIVINGDMSIDQRGITATANNQFPVDRFFYNDAQNYDQLSFSATQDTDVPTGQGFAKSLKVTVNTPETAIASDEYSRIMTRFEGQNVQQLKYGTSSAESVTLSFWLKTNVTGNFTVSLFQDDDSRIIGTTYSATSSGVWEKITITFDPDTVGVIDNDNGSGLRVMFLLTAGTNFTSSDNTSWGSYSNAKLAYGQTASLMSTTSGYWNITGVQLEVGTSASDFEFLPYDVNLRRCQRYYEILGYDGGSGNALAVGQKRSTSSAQGSWVFRVDKRTNPTLSLIGDVTDLRIHDPNGGNLTGSSISGNGTPGKTAVWIGLNTSNAGLDNTPCVIYMLNNNGGAGYTADAEL